MFLMRFDSHTLTQFNLERAMSKLTELEKLESDINQIYARANRLRAVKRLREGELAEYPDDHSTFTRRQKIRVMQLLDFINIVDNEFEYLNEKLETLRAHPLCIKALKARSLLL
jgi:hypothetical protein